MTKVAKEPPVNMAARVLLVENGWDPDTIVRVNPADILWVGRDGHAYTTFIEVDGKTVSTDTVRGFELD